MRNITWFLVAAATFASLWLIAPNGSLARKEMPHTQITQPIQSVDSRLTPNPSIRIHSKPSRILIKSSSSSSSRRQKLHELQRRRQLSHQAEVLDIDDKINEANLQRQKIDKELRRKQLDCKSNSGVR